jgi:gluconate/galactonate dehydratase
VPCPASNRRRFLQLSALAAAPLFRAPYSRLAAALHRKIKITDVKCMIVRGTWDWNLIKIETDAGLYGIELNPDVARAHLAPGETWWG